MTGSTKVSQSDEMRIERSKVDRRKRKETSLLEKISYFLIEMFKSNGE